MRGGGAAEGLRAFVDARVFIGDHEELSFDEKLGMADLPITGADQTVKLLGAEGGLVEVDGFGGVR